MHSFAHQSGSSAPRHEKSLLHTLSRVVRLIPLEQRLTIKHWLWKREYDRRRKEVLHRGEGDQRLTLTLRSFDEHRCIFVHIPKSAGISVAMALFNNAGASHYDARYFRLVFGADFWKYFKFTFVRNPFTRLASAYEFLKRGGLASNPYDATFRTEVLSRYKDFDDFVLQWLTPERETMRPHFRPQVSYLMLGDTLAMDFIGRFETLEEDFQTVARRLGIQARLPHLNRTPIDDGESIDHFANDAVVRRVQDVYRRDFELLGYSPKPPSAVSTRLTPTGT